MKRINDMYETINITEMDTIILLKPQGDIIYRNFEELVDVLQSICKSPKKPTRPNRLHDGKHFSFMPLPHRPQ